MWTQYTVIESGLSLRSYENCGSYETYLPCPMNKSFDLVSIEFELNLSTCELQFLLRIPEIICAVSLANLIPAPRYRFFAHRQLEYLYFFFICMYDCLKNHLCRFIVPTSESMLITVEC